MLGIAARHLLRHSVGAALLPGRAALDDRAGGAGGTGNLALVPGLHATQALRWVGACLALLAALRRATGKHRVLVIEEEGNEIKCAQRFRTANFGGHVDIRFRKGSDLTSAAFTESLIAQVQEGEYDVLMLDPEEELFSWEDGGTLMNALIRRAARDA